MFKARSLGSGLSRLHIHSIRALWAPRVVRSFATTLNVSGHQRPKSPRRHGHQDTNRKSNTPTIETNDLKSHELQEPTLPSTQASGRDIHPETEGETIGDTSLPIAWDDAKKEAPGKLYGDSKVPHAQIAREDEAANDDQSKAEEVPWRDRMGYFYRSITVPQDFHARLHERLLTNIMRSGPVLRGMPVYDPTFDAVQSGKNLFMKSQFPPRSLQYMLPIIQGILDFGVWRRRREVKPDAQLPHRPSTLLVLCPTLWGAQDVLMMGTRLIRGHDAGVDMMVLSDPTHKQINALRIRGSNILISTPEHIFQWLALPHTKIPLNEALLDVQTLVVDGQASYLRHGDFLDLLKEVMKDLPLNMKTQRVIISDEHDAQLDELLTSVVLHGGFELLQEPRLEEIMEMQRAQEKKRRERIKSQRGAKKGKGTPKKRGVGKANERF